MVFVSQWQVLDFDEGTNRRSFQDQPLFPSSPHASISSLFGRFQVMKFKALVPPSTFPRGHGKERPPSPGWPTVSNCQSRCVPSDSPYRPGTLMARVSKVASPASNTPTVTLCSLNRAATARCASTHDQVIEGLARKVLRTAVGNTHHRTDPRSLRVVASVTLGERCEADAVKRSCSLTLRTENTRPYCKYTLADVAHSFTIAARLQPLWCSISTLMILHRIAMEPTL